jgi:hypothetical protein
LSNIMATKRLFEKERKIMPKQIRKENWKINWKVHSK